MSVTPRGDAHARNAAAMRQVNLDAQLAGEENGAGAAHRTARHAAFAGQDAAVGHERHKAAAFELVAQRLLVVGKSARLAAPAACVEASPW